MRKHSRNQPEGLLAKDLILECESLLAGRYADFLGSLGKVAPPWAWLNALAHCSEPELTARAGTVDEITGANEWRQALAFLAGEVLGQIHETGMTLRQLQRSTLIPLELELSRRPDDASMHPGQLAALVLAALQRRPSRRQP